MRAEPVSLGVPGGDWVLRLVTAARRSPGLGWHLTIAALLAIILGICLRTGIVPMRIYVSDVVFLPITGGAFCGGSGLTWTTRARLGR